MKTVIWVSAVSAILAITAAVMIYRVFYYPASNPLLRDFPQEA